MQLNYKKTNSREFLAHFYFFSAICLFHFRFFTFTLNQMVKKMFFSRKCILLLAAAIHNQAQVCTSFNHTFFLDVVFSTIVLWHRYWKKQKQHFIILIERNTRRGRPCWQQTLQWLASLLCLNKTWITPYTWHMTPSPNTWHLTSDT